MEKFNVALLKNGSTAKQYAERVTELLGQSAIEFTDISDSNDDWKSLNMCIISEEKDGLMRNAKRSQGRKVRYIQQR
jgi:hypothetical protein